MNNHVQLESLAINLSQNPWILLDTLGFTHTIFVIRIMILKFKYYDIIDLTSKVQRKQGMEKAAEMEQSSH